MLVSFQPDGQTPTQAVFDFPKVFKTGLQGKVTIHDWRVNAVAKDELFAPPAGLPTREVDQADLHHVFSAIFDFAIERTE